MISEVELWGGEVPVCRQATNYPYVQCDCPIHDFVAELLDIHSTRKEGYKPKRQPKDPGRNIRPLTAAEAVKYLVPAANTVEPKDPPPPRMKPRWERSATERRPIGPVKPTPRYGEPAPQYLGDYQRKLKSNLARIEASVQRDVERVKALEEKSYQLANYLRVDSAGEPEYVYEMGNPEPVEVIYPQEDKQWINEFGCWLPTHGGKFHVQHEIDGGFKLLYVRNGVAAHLDIDLTSDVYEVADHLTKLVTAMQLRQDPLGFQPH